MPDLVSHPETTVARITEKTQGLVVLLDMNTVVAAVGWYVQISSWQVQRGENVAISGHRTKH